jgi:hypothetical protein
MATRGGPNPEPTGVNPGRCLVRKYMSIGLTTLLTLSALICLVLTSGADIVGPP